MKKLFNAKLFVDTFLRPRRRTNSGILIPLILAAVLASCAVAPSKKWEEPVPPDFGGRKHGRFYPTSIYPEVITDSNYNLKKEKAGCPQIPYLISPQGLK